MSKPINFYIITSTNTDKVYIGSTSNTLSQRLSNHKTNNSCTSKFIINAGNFSIDLLETVECNPEERAQIEYKYIQEYGENIINKNKGYWKDANHEKKYYQNYYQSNKEKLAETKNSKVLCECGSYSVKGSIARHKKTKKHLEFISS